MPQGLLHHLEIDPGGEHERRRSMAQVVQSHRRQVGRHGELVEVVGERGRVQRFPVLAGEHLP
ncbi:MAG TPA: hypothetical protein VFO16_06810 [Pseudonocardiaceae bacterium]|nr:hypothetical protein [Pseudonocardiaceae bacterium]